MLNTVVFICKEKVAVSETVILFWFIQLLNVFDLFSSGSWKFGFCLFAYFCPRAGDGGVGGKQLLSLVKIQESNILLWCSRKIKLRCHQPWTMKRAWSLGTKREPRVSEAWDFAVSIWQHLYKTILSCQIRKLSLLFYVILILYSLLNDFMRGSRWHFYIH